MPEFESGKIRGFKIFKISSIFFKTVLYFSVVVNVLLRRYTHPFFEILEQDYCSFDNSTILLMQFWIPCLLKSVH